MAEVFGVGVGLVDGLLEAVLVVKAKLVVLGDTQSIRPGKGEEEGAGALFSRRFVFDGFVGVLPARSGVKRFELAPVHRLPVVERVEAGDPPAACEDMAVARSQFDDGAGGVLGSVAAHLGDGVVGEQVYGVIAVGVADVGSNEAVGDLAGSPFLNVGRGGWMLGNRCLRAVVGGMGWGKDCVI